MVFKKGDIGYWKGKTGINHPMFNKRQSKKSNELNKLAHINKHPSEKTKEKMSSIHLGMPSGKKGKHLSEQTIRKIRLNLKGRESWNKGKIRIFSETTIQRMSAIKINNPNRKFINTSIELKLQNELYRRGIRFTTQVPVGKITICDIFIPDKNIVIFADGCYYHGCQYCRNYYNIEKQSKDEKISQELEFKGYKVYRFWEHEINSNIEECVNKIILSKEEIKIDKIVVKK